MLSSDEKWSVAGWPLLPPQVFRDWRGGGGGPFGNLQINEQQNLIPASLSLSGPYPPSRGYRHWKREPSLPVWRIHNELMRIRILLFTLMRIRLQIRILQTVRYLPSK